MKYTLFPFLLFLLNVQTAFAQEEEDDEQKKIANVVKATDFSIPSSPAFTLLDVTPAKVNKPAFAKDFKFDWVFSEGNIRPNIAIEAQPVWLFGAKNVNLAKYQQKNYFIMRQLSTLSVSVGTVRKDTIQSLAWGVKLNLFREKRSDPMQNTAFIKSMTKIVGFSPEETQTLLKLQGMRKRLRETEDTEVQDSLQSEISILEEDLNSIDERDREALKSLRKRFADENWNASMVDVGYGRVYNYSGELMDALTFRNNMSGAWINASYNFGWKKVLLSGMYRWLGNDSTTQSVGANLRYGSSTLNFFVEYVYESNDAARKNTIAYGGDFRISSQLLVQFGIRTEYNKEFSLKSLRPMVNLNWLLKDKKE